jgi:hypothetical protein
MISIVVAAIGKSGLAQKCSARTTSSIRAEIYGKTRATPPAFDRIAQKYTV